MGLGAAVAVLLTFLAPYLVAAGPSVTVYYTRGLVNGFGVVLLTGVALLLFARAALGERLLPLATGVLAGVGLFTLSREATSLHLVRCRVAEIDDLGEGVRFEVRDSLTDPSSKRSPAEEII